MFKVGDKVCDPIKYGNGIVTRIYEAHSGRTNNNLLVVDFGKGITWSYSLDGFDNLVNKLPNLYHGHMEEGTGKITFEPKKEPVYEWQWEYVNTTKECICTTGFYTSEKEMLDNWAGTWRKDFIRIERSKRERKE